LALAVAGPGTPPPDKVMALRELCCFILLPQHPPVAPHSDLTFAICHERLSLAYAKVFEFSLAVAGKKVPDHLRRASASRLALHAVQIARRAMVACWLWICFAVVIAAKVTAKAIAIEKTKKTKRGVIERAPFQDAPRVKSNLEHRTFKAAPCPLALLGRDASSRSRQTNGAS
jgi:hypothetical protein